MDIDWKDKLGALLESGAVPVDNTPDIPEESDSNKISTASRLKVITDRKGRKGKTATIIEGFQGSDKELEDLAKTLKQKLGTGGRRPGRRNSHSGRPQERCHIHPPKPRLQG